MLKCYGLVGGGGCGGGWPTGLIGVETGLDWVGIVSGGIGD